MSAVALGPGREPGQPLRWTAAALLVAGVHVGAGWWLVGHALVPPPEPEGPPAVTIELSPISVPVSPTADPKPMENGGPAREPQVAEAPDAPLDQTQPAADAPPPSEPPPPAAEQPAPPVAAEPPPVEAAVAPPPEPTPPAPQRKPDPTPPTPAPVPEAVPPPAPAPSDAVLAPPPPPPRPVPPVKKTVAPKPPKPVPPKPDPREVERQQAREARAEAREEAREEARRDAKAQATAEARSQRQAAREQARAARAAVAREGGGNDRASAAPAASVASGASMAGWQGELAAHLRAYKPDVQVASGGTARVRITIDSGGRVTSASLASSSGDGTLDQAAVSMMHRASPVPAPPPGAGRQAITVPVYFH